MLTPSRKWYYERNFGLVLCIKSYLRILTGKKHTKIKLSAYENTDMDIWVVGTSNKPFSRGSKTETNFSKKLKKLLAKLHSLWWVHFVVLTLASTKKRYSSFLKKCFVFQIIWIKVNVLKTFKISTDCHIKACRSLKRRAILKIPGTVL